MSSSAPLYSCLLAAPADLNDLEIEWILHRVYVEGGFTTPESGRAIFEAASVRARGPLLVVRDPCSRLLLGLVSVAFPGSPSRRVAVDQEAELQALAVLPEARRQGIGRLLVEGAMALAATRGNLHMVLWTQGSMDDAHRLYERLGFTRQPERDVVQGSRACLVYQATLAPPKASPEASAPEETPTL